MKKSIFILSVLTIMLFGTKTYSQSTLSPNVLAVGGFFGESSTHSLSYTIGEMVAVETFTSSANIFTQGFQQPEPSLDVSVQDVMGGAAFLVYPVPASTMLNVESSLPEFKVVLMSIEGKELSSLSVQNGIATFNLTKFAKGAYLVQLKDVTEKLIGTKQFIIN